VQHRRAFFRRVQVERYGSRRELELALTERLHLIAIVATNAPYVGLLGTVLGIMLTFALMGPDGQIDSGRIMAGLALAYQRYYDGNVARIRRVVERIPAGQRVRVYHWLRDPCTRSGSGMWTCGPRPRGSTGPSTGSASPTPGPTRSCIPTRRPNEAQVGLIIPHITRMLVGPGNRILVPSAALVGAIYMVVVDDLSRLLFHFELPIGIATSLLGTPFFLLV
jgi:hypothetical protein